MIIGLHGRIGAGKNEAAKRLSLMSPDVVEVSFARKLKESAAALLGCTVDDLERWKNEPYRLVAVGVDVNDLGFVETTKQTVRSFLQRYGTESHRDVFGDGFWVDAALPMRGTHSPAPLRSVDLDYERALYVVTDVRFPNEAQRVHELGGTVIGLLGSSTTGGSHVSEIPLDCDRWIDNTIRDDNYTSLDRQLRALLNEIRLPIPA